MMLSALFSLPSLSFLLICLIYYCPSLRGITDRFHVHNMKLSVSKLLYYRILLMIFAEMQEYNFKTAVSGWSHYYRNLVERGSLLATVAVKILTNVV